MHCMKRKVDEPFKGSRKWLAVTNDGRTTIDTVEILRLEDLFSIENTIFSVQKYLKATNSAPEHAR